MQRRHCWAAAAALGASAARGETPLSVPPPGSSSAPIYNYAMEVLQLALQLGGVRAPLQPTENVPQSHWVREMELARPGFDVNWFMTNHDRERRLEPVRVPLFMGLFGWRLLMVLPSQRDALKPLRSVVDWRRVPLAQGTDWPDTDVLRSNQLTVRTALHMNDLYGLLNSGQAQAFPRALMEAFGEAAQRPGHVIEPNWVLHYPAAMYFFVNRRRPEVLAGLRQGLTGLARSGALRQRFMAHFGAVLKLAALPERRVLRLTNPNLPKATPLDEDDWWWQPG